MKPSQEKRKKIMEGAAQEGREKLERERALWNPGIKTLSKWRKWSVMSNSRGKLAGDLKASIEFCKKVVIYDLPGSTLNEGVWKAAKLPWTEERIGDHTGGREWRLPFEETGNRRHRQKLQDGGGVGGGGNGAGSEDFILVRLGNSFYRLLKRIDDPRRALMGKATEL